MGTIQRPARRATAQGRDRPARRPARGGPRQTDRDAARAHQGCGDAARACSSTRTRLPCRGASAAEGSDRRLRLLRDETRSAHERQLAAQTLLLRQRRAGSSMEPTGQGRRAQQHATRLPRPAPGTATLRLGLPQHDPRPGSKGLRGEQRGHAADGLPLLSEWLPDATGAQQRTRRAALRQQPRHLQQRLLPTGEHQLLSLRGRRAAAGDLRREVSEGAAHVAPHPTRTAVGAATFHAEDADLETLRRYLRDDEREQEHDRLLRQLPDLGGQRQLHDALGNVWQHATRRPGEGRALPRPAGQDSGRRRAGGGQQTAQLGADGLRV